jgi:hypothetical protein
MHKPNCTQNLIRYRIVDRTCFHNRLKILLKCYNYKNIPCSSIEEISLSESEWHANQTCGLHTRTAFLLFSPGSLLCHPCHLKSPIDSARLTSSRESIPKHCVWGTRWKRVGAPLKKNTLWGKLRKVFAMYCWVLIPLYECIPA